MFAGNQGQRNFTKGGTATQGWNSCGAHKGAAAISGMQLLYQRHSCYIKGAAVISRVEQQYQGQSSYIKCGAAISSAEQYIKCGAATSRAILTSSRGRWANSLAKLDRSGQRCARVSEGVIWTHTLPCMLVRGICRCPMVANLSVELLARAAGCSYKPDQNGCVTDRHRCQGAGAETVCIHVARGMQFYPLGKHTLISRGSTLCIKWLL